MNGPSKKHMDDTQETQAVPIHVTDDVFEELVLQSDVPVVVDFWAPWCAPCRMIAPVLEQVAADYGGRALVAKVNTDENPAWANKFGVRGIPTLLFIWQGHEAGRIVGAVPVSTIQQVLDQIVPSGP